MNTRDDHELVRPIGIDHDDGADPDRLATQHATSESTERRRWLPLAISISAIVLVIGVVSAFGALQFDEAASQDPAVFASNAGEADTTQGSSALPPRLDELVPGLNDRLTLVVETEDGLRSLVWEPSFRIPEPHTLSVGTLGRTDAVTVKFDSAGRSIAIGVPSSVGTDVYLGSPTEMSKQPSLIDVSSFAWHATQAGSIAWIARDAAGGTQLHSATLDPLSGSVVENIVINLDSSASIIRWDAAGFLINSLLNDDMAVISLNPDGSQLWSRRGVATSASRSIVATMVPDETKHYKRWVVIDRASGEPVGQPIDGSPADVWMTTSLDTNLIGVVAMFDRRTSLTINGPRIATRRIIQIDTRVSPIGFSATSEYFLFDALDSNDIVFVNWRTGATHTVPIPSEYEVISQRVG